jgi:molecular chaperone Hsp33
VTRKSGATQSVRIVGDDVVLPFAVPALDVRGQAVQLGGAIDAIVGGHGYPAPVARLVAEAVTLTALAGASLKFEGKFSLQTRSDGPVSLLVADYRTDGALRAYARFDEAAVAALAGAGKSGPATLLGAGTLALTIDQGPDMQRYQGVVALDGSGLETAAQEYFLRSEQIPSVVRLAVGELLLPSPTGGPPVRHWRAGGLIAQFLPAAPARMRDLPPGDAPQGAVPQQDIPEEESWVEAQALAQTASAEELTDPAIGSERLLYRLFHERGVRVFPGKPVRHECACSHGRIVAILRSLSPAERDASFEGGRASAKCEFCGKTYFVDRDQL